MRMASRPDESPLAKFEIADRLIFIVFHFLLTEAPVSINIVYLPQLFILCQGKSEKSNLRLGRGLIQSTVRKRSSFLLSTKIERIERAI